MQFGIQKWAFLGFGFWMNMGFATSQAHPAWIDDIFCRLEVSMERRMPTYVEMNAFKAKFLPRSVYQNGDGSPWDIPDGEFKNGDEFTLRLENQNYVETLEINFRHLDAGDHTIQAAISFYPSSELGTRTHKVLYRGTLAKDAREVQVLNLNVDFTSNGSESGIPVKGGVLDELKVTCGYQSGWSKVNRETCEEFSRNPLVRRPTPGTVCTAVSRAEPRTKHYPILSEDEIAEGASEVQAVSALKKQLCDRGVEFRDLQIYCKPKR